MAARVESVPNPAFSVSPLTTTSGTIVSRRQVRLPCNFPTTYSHNRQSQKPFQVALDIHDPESFLDTRSLRLALTFEPKFTINGAAYPARLRPVIDGSTQSLMARLQISNAQGVIIEDIVNYGLFTAHVNKYNQNAVHKSTNINDFSDTWLTKSNVQTDGLANSTGTGINKSAVLASNNVKYELFISFQQSSFFQRCRMLPLFLWRSALRINIEFQDPRLAFYEPIIRGSPIASVSFPFVEGKDAEATFIDGIVPDAIVLEEHATGNVVYSTNTAGSLIEMGYRCNDTPRVPYARRDTTVSAQHVFKRPAFLATSAAGAVVAENGPIVWDYDITNVEALCDFIKPSSDVLMQYLNAFNMDTGMAWAYNRLFYHQKITENGNMVSPTQISLPFGVRSLKGIMVLITDQLATYAGRDNTVMRFPSMTSGMMRGLREAELVVGAQRFPGYKLMFNTATGNATPDTFVNQHFQEIEHFFNTTSNVLVTPNFHPCELQRYGTDYGMCGAYDVTSVAFGNPNAAPDGNVDEQTWRGSSLPFNSKFAYKDTRSFLLCFSTMKSDGDFASGIDTTAAGSISLNLHFDSHFPVRPRTIHIWGIADSVFTLQKDASLVRY